MLTERKISLTTKAQVALGVVCLLCGIGIYLLFRSESIRLYQWCDAVGVTGPIDMLRQETLQWRVPEFVRNSLPDGLYCCSYILLMDAVWKKGQALPFIMVGLRSMISCTCSHSSGVTIASWQPSMTSQSSRGIMS